MNTENNDAWSDVLNSEFHNAALVTVRTFNTPQEAAIAKGLLEHNNIRAWITGDLAVSTLFYVGTALGGVRLEVAEAHAAEASQLLSTEFDQHPETPAWNCPQCKAEVDAGFDVCWQCGAEYLADDSLANGESDSIPHDAWSVPDAGEPTAEFRHVETANAGVDHAWKSAIFGIVFPPLIIYSFYLLITQLNVELGKSGTRKFYAAFVLSALGTFMWWFVLTSGFVDLLYDSW